MESIFNKIIGENFHNLKNEMPMKVQAHGTPNRLDQKRKFYWHIIIKTPNKEVLEAVMGKEQVTYKSRPIRNNILKHN